MERGKGRKREEEEINNKEIKKKEIKWKEWYLNTTYTFICQNK